MVIFHIKFPDYCKKYVQILGYKDAMDLEVSEQEAYLSNGILTKRHNDLGITPAALLPATMRVTKQACNHKNGLLLLKEIQFSSMGGNECSTLHFRGTF